MTVTLDNVVPLKIPKKPRIKLHESPPDQRRLCVVPIRACIDKQITLGMMRTFVLICSYMNRSGITWVSQNTLASKLGISQQGISKHLIKLVKAGYLEVMRKPRPGERTTTWRVIFDPNISGEDAISLVSTIEDTRPPWMKEEQASAPDPAGQRRIADLVAKALNQPPRKEPTMPAKGQSRTVQKMKEDIAKVKSRRSKTQPSEVVSNPVDNTSHTQPPEVVQPIDLQAQPFDAISTTSRGCAEREEQGIDKVVMYNQVVKELYISQQQFEEHLECIIEAYRIEGLTPNPDRLPAEILQLHRDTNR